MTDLASAMADTSSLPDYGGQPVVKTTISIRNAGDGLSEGLGIDPQLLAIGSRVYVVLECLVKAHDHKMLENAKDQLVLDQVLKAGTGTLIDAVVVREAIAAQAERIQAAKDAAAGRQRIPYDDDAEALAVEHLDAAKGHATLVPGCPECDKEVDAAAAEAVTDEQWEASATAAPAEADNVAPITGRKPRKPRTK